MKHAIDRLDQAMNARDASEQSEAATECSRILNQIAELMNRGHMITAAAINADAGNPIGWCALRIENGLDLPAGLRLPQAPSLDAMVKLPATARDHTHLHHVWLEANLTGAPQHQRLEAAHDLMQIGQESEIWEKQYGALLQAYIPQLQVEVDSALSSGDLAQMECMLDRISDMHVDTLGRGKLFRSLEIAIADIRSKETDHKLESLQIKAIEAWAAMDPSAASDLLAQWHDTANHEGGRNDLTMQSLQHWVADEMTRSRERAHADAAIADLERSLDEIAPIQDVEKRYASLKSAGINIPPAVESRVAYRIAEVKRSKFRRWILSLAALVLLAITIVSLVNIRERSLERQRVIDMLNTCITSNLQDGLLREAIDCWTQANASSMLDDPSVAIHAAEIRRAKETLEKQAQDARDRFASIQSQATKASFDLITANALISSLEEIEDQIPIDLRPDWTSLLSSLQQQRRLAMGEATSNRLQEIQESIARVPTSEPASSDLDSWRSRRQHLEVIQGALLEIGAKPGAEGLEVRNRLDRHTADLNRLLQTCDDRIELIKQTQEAMRVLEDVPLRESQWLEAWTLLMDSISEGSLDPELVMAYQQGIQAAQSSVAVQDWRRIFRRIQDAGLWSVDGSGMHGAAGEAKTSLQSHLDQFGRRSPYHKTAEQLIEIARLMQQTPTQQSIPLAIERSGILDLVRARSEDGWIYLKQSGGRYHVVSTRLDLTVPAGSLEPLTGEQLRLATDAGEIGPPPIIQTLQNVIRAWRGNHVPASIALADLVASLEQTPEPDTLLTAAIWEIVLNAAISMQGALPESTGHAIESWLDDAPLNRRDVNDADWARLAPQAELVTQRELRKNAVRSLQGIPTSLEISQDWEVMASALESQSDSREIIGILTPRSDTSFGITLEGAPGTGEALFHRGNGWMFAEIDDLEHGQTIMAPADMPHAPAIIFRKQ